jgi:hypothetical protein
MTAKRGDRIFMLGKVKKANPNERGGVVEEVLSEDPPRYAIRWDSGRLTVLAPLPGAIRVEAAKPSRRPAAAKAKAPAKAAPKPAAKAPAAKPAAKKRTAKTSS